MMDGLIAVNGTVVSVVKAGTGAYVYLSTVDGSVTVKIADHGEAFKKGEKVHASGTLDKYQTCRHKGLWLTAEGAIEVKEVPTGETMESHLAPAAVAFADEKAKREEEAAIEILEAELPEGMVPVDAAGAEGIGPDGEEEED